MCKIYRFRYGQRFHDWDTTSTYDKNNARVFYIGYLLYITLDPTFDPTSEFKFLYLHSI